jgi:hypothetical protein
MKKEGTTELGATAPKNTKQAVTADSGKPKRNLKAELQARAKKAGIVGYEKMGNTALAKRLKQLKKEGKIEDGRKNNGGHENGGRKPDLDKDPKYTEIKKNHLDEEVDVIITDKRTGKTKSEKKKTMIAMLDQLRKDAFKGDSVHERVRAIHEYFDRTLGKSKQEVEFTNPIKAEDQRPPTANEIAAAELLEEDDDYDE